MRDTIAIFLRFFLFYIHYCSFVWALVAVFLLHPYRACIAEGPQAKKAWVSGGFFDKDRRFATDKKQDQEGVEFGHTSNGSSKAGRQGQSLEVDPSILEESNRALQEVRDGTAKWLAEASSEESNKDKVKFLNSEAERIYGKGVQFENEELSPEEEELEVRKTVRKKMADIEDVPWAKERIQKMQDMAAKNAADLKRSKTGEEAPFETKPGGDARSRALPAYGLSTVSLIIPAAPVENLEKELKELLDLREKKRVRIGEVIVIGVVAEDIKRLNYLKSKAEAIRKLDEEGGPNGDYARSPPDFEQQIKEFIEPTVFDKMGFSYFQDVNMDILLIKYGITGTPAWVVNFAKKNYVIEGPPSIWSMFTKEGNFTPASDPRDFEKLTEESHAGFVDKGQFLLISNEDPIFRIPTTSRKEPIKVGADSEIIYRYMPDVE